MAHFYADNRRDGSRLLSSAVVIATIGLIRSDLPVGRWVAGLGAVVSLYWWSRYRRLDH